MMKKTRINKWKWMVLTGFDQHPCPAVSVLQVEKFQELCLILNPGLKDMLLPEV